MGSWTQIASADFRNDGWGLTGTGVSKVFEAWNNDDDGKYITNPANKGRVAVTFPIDPTDLPEGAVITNVKIKVRAEKTTSDEAALNVNVMAKDNTSRYTSTSIFLSTTPTDYEVASYTHDPLSLPWDIFRINQLVAQCWVFGLLSGLIRIFKCWFEIEYHERPTVNITSPSGNQGTSSPTVAWTYDQEDGDLQEHVDYKIFHKSTAQAVGFDPEFNTPVTGGRKFGDIRSFILPYALPPGNYVIYLRAMSDHHCHSKWDSKSFSVLAPVPGVPQITPTVDAANSAVDLDILDASNILTAAQANWGDADDAIEYITTNCSVARDTAEYLNTVGLASYKLTASSAADMSIITPPIDCAAVQDVTLRASFRADSTGRTVNVVAEFLDTDYTSLGTLTATGTDSTTWSEVNNTGTTPAGTNYVTVKLEVVAPASSEVHNVDAIGFMYGSDVPWTDGGHLNYNLLDSDYSSNPGLADWTAGPATLTSSITPSGTGARGPNALRLTCNPSAADIAFVAAGTVHTATSSGTSVTLNIPTVADNDTLIATVSANSDGTITPPSGWELVNTAHAEDFSQHVLYKVASSEPSSYNATLEFAASIRVTRVVAYRNVSTSDPFIDEAISSQSTGTPLTYKTAELNNTDSKAWRVGAFSVLDNNTAGSLVARETAEGGISFVGEGTPWGDNETSNFTIHKPSGVAEDDLMLAFVANAGTGTPSTPTGWTQVRTISSTDGSDMRLTVFRKVAGASEPTSWSGTLSSASDAVNAYAVAYRSIDGTTPILDEGGNTSSGGTNTLATATVNNTDNRSWRVLAFAARDATSSMSWSVNNAIERVDMEVTDVDSGWWYSTYDTVGMAVYDSNGPISSGNTNATASNSRSFDGGASWLGLIKADPSVPATPPAETERYESTAGTFVDQMVCDSAATISEGAQQLSATFTPGSGTDLTTALSWMAILRPTDDNALVVGATMTNKVDISSVASEVLGFADHKVTFTAHFKGSTAGTPYLRLYFYRANQLLSSSLSVGSNYETSEWTRSTVTFDLPEGTTHIQGDVYSPNRTLSSTVDVDALNIMFGETGNFYRGGSYREAHPVWAIPVIEYADDNGDGILEWKELPGILPRPPIYDPASGVSEYTDLYPTPGIVRNYRTRTRAYGLAGDLFHSDYSSVAQVTPTADSWWIKDIVDPDNNMAIKVRAENWEATTTNTAAVFQPLGELYPVVLTEGYKADVVELQMVMQKQEWQDFQKLLRLNRSLFLQSDQDVTWWVRPVEDVSAETLVSFKRATDPYRFVTQKFVEVRPEL